MSAPARKLTRIEIADRGGADAWGPPSRWSGLLAPLRRVVATAKGKWAVGGLLAFILLGVVGPMLPLPDPQAIDHTRRLQGPSGSHLLGTDEFGRDILSRIIDGIGITLFVSALSIGIALVVGVSTGIVAAYRGGWLDAAIMRCYDALLAMPDVILAIAIAALIGTGARNAVIALAVVGTPHFARIVRASCRGELPRTYIEAVISLGSSRWRVMFKHLLPNVIGPIAVQTAVFGAMSVLVLAGLSFLGLGVQPPAPSLGGMLSTARQFLPVAPWYAIGPGLAITLLVLILNALADRARDITDRRGR